MKLKNPYASLVFLSIMKFNSTAFANESIPIAYEEDEPNTITVKVDRRLLEEEIFIEDQKTLLKLDKRKVKGEQDSHLDAVGKLIISYDGRTKTGNCSAGLIASVPGKGSSIIASASHCFRAGKKKIHWVSALANGEIIQRSAQEIAFSNKLDISLLRLDKPIAFNKIKPFLIFSDLFYETDDFLFYATEFIVAGYSGDELKGNKGKNLTYTTILNKYKDEDVYINFYDIDATNYQGSSGGVIAAKADLSVDGIENPHNQLYYIGVLTSVSTENEIDGNFYKSGSVKGASKTVFVPFESLIINLQGDVYLDNDN